MIYGYARVSTDGQSVDAQVKQLRAKARGVKMGPKFKLTPHQQREAIKRRDTKGEPVREIARTQRQPQHDFTA
jgi:DNA invertase Pin-like site-specific DNA recombinase